MYTRSGVGKQTAERANHLNKVANTVIVNDVKLVDRKSVV